MQQLPRWSLRSQVGILAESLRNQRPESRAIPSYFKGANVLHTIRQLVGDDARWNAILLGLTRTFRHRLVTGAEIEDYIGRASGGRRWLRPTTAWQRLPVPSRTGAELMVDESFYVTSRNLAGSSSQRP